MRSARAHPSLVGILRGHAADLLALFGAALIGVGVYQLKPVATWFYAGLVALVTAYMVMRAER